MGLVKNKAGYGYKYADLSQTNEYLAEQGIHYYQYTETTESGDDYVYTVPIIDGKELPARRGCKVVQATLSGKSNPAQEQGSALTYARRYSLWMAFGLATEDDDAQMLTKKKEPSEAPRPKTRTEQLKERLASDPPRVRFVKFFEANNLDLYRFLDANNLATIDDIDEELAEMALTEKGMKALRERYKR